MRQLFRGRTLHAPSASPDADSILSVDGVIRWMGPFDQAPVADKQVDLDGVLLPGMIDSHAHLTGLGMALRQVDLSGALSLDEALWRVRAFADAGADVLFIDALASIEEMKAFCAVSPKVPKMANMLEGGGKTPILSPAELQEIGFSLIVYPLSLIGVSMLAMEDALIAIKSTGAPRPGSLPSFQEIKDTLGFNRYYKEEKQ